MSIPVASCSLTMLTKSGSVRSSELEVVEDDTEETAVLGVRPVDAPEGQRRTGKSAGGRVGGVVSYLLQENKQYSSCGSRLSVA